MASTTSHSNRQLSDRHRALGCRSCSFADSTGTKTSLIRGESSCISGPRRTASASCSEAGLLWPRGLACVPRLQQMMGRIFPQLRSVRVSHAWVGWVAYTFDTLPHLGQHEGIHYCMGYCGQGGCSRRSPAGASDSKCWGSQRDAPLSTSYLSRRGRTIAGIRGFSRRPCLLIA